MKTQNSVENLGVRYPKSISPFPGYLQQRDRESSDLIRRYLQGVKYLARNKQRRCISQELG